VEHAEVQLLDKKNRQRQRIIQSAADLFIQKGARAVSMDDIALSAELSRRTLFNYFPSKDELLYEVAEPVLTRALQLAAQASAGLQPGLEDIVRLTLDLWHDCGSRLGLIYMVELEESPRLAGLHAAFLKQFQSLTATASGRAGLEPGDARLAGRLVYRLFLPFLQALEPLADLDQRYMQGFSALLRSTLKMV